MPENQIRVSGIEQSVVPQSEFLSLTGGIGRKSHVVALLAIVTVVYFPAVYAWHELNDDHFLLYQSSSSIHQQLPERPTLQEVFHADVTYRGHFAPVQIGLHFLHANLFGQHPWLFRSYLLLMAGVTAVFLYGFGTVYWDSAFAGFLFSIWLMICPAAGDVWPHMVRGESVGMFLISVILWLIWVPERNRPAASILAGTLFAVLCLEKENFFVLFPAFAWLAYSRGNQVGLALAKKSHLRLTAGFCIVGITTGLVIFVVLLRADGASHAGKSMNLSSTDGVILISRLKSILMKLASNGMLFIPHVALVLIQWKAGLLSRRILAGGILPLLIALPQILIYLTRDSFESRYAFPMMIAVALPGALAIDQIFSLVRRPKVRLILGLTVVAVFSRWAQVQITECMNLAAETQALRQFCKTIVQSIDEQATVILVAPQKSEGALASLTYIGYYGRPNSHVILFQPDGSDGHSEFGFSGRNSLDQIASGGADCVAFLPGSSSIISPELATCMNEKLKLREIKFARHYLSLRSQKMIHVPDSFRLYSRP